MKYTYPKEIAGPAKAALATAKEAMVKAKMEIIEPAAIKIKLIETTKYVRGYWCFYSEANKTHVGGEVHATTNRRRPCVWLCHGPGDRSKIDVRVLAHELVHCLLIQHGIWDHDRRFKRLVHGW